MYDTMGHQFFWTQMANDVHTTKKECRSCAQDGSQIKHKRKLQMFPAAEPLEFMTLNLLEPLPKMLSGSQHVRIMTYRCSKVIRAIPTGKLHQTILRLYYFTIW